jgi:hypothetical protein
MLKINGEWYRLKGCGNNEEGFLVKQLLPDDLYTIRGSSYEHTAIRELHFTEKVDAALRKEGYRGSNRGLGWFEYHLPGDKFPAIKKTCSIFLSSGSFVVGRKKLGERRK